MPAIQNGDEATITAVSPLGTHCSAQATAPLPMHQQQKPEQRPRCPTSIDRAGVRRATRDSPRAAGPAIVQRMPDISSGGIVSSVTRMPRYVVPQIRQTSTHAN